MDREENRISMIKTTTKNMKDHIDIVVIGIEIEIGKEIG